MLKWSILDPAASQFKLVDEQTVNELLPQLKLDLRLRTKVRGGGWRLDQALSRAKDLLTEGEVLLTESQLTIINESANVIVEGFFADAWEKAKEVGGKVVNAIGKANGIEFKLVRYKNAKSTTLGVLNKEVQFGISNSAKRFWKNTKKLNGHYVQFDVFSRAAGSTLASVRGNKSQLDKLLSCLLYTSDAADE